MRRIRWPMEKLTERDFRNILSAAEILARDLDYATFPQRAVDAIATIIDTDFISFNEIDTKRGVSRFLLKPDPTEFKPGSPEHLAFIRRFGNHPVIADRIVRSGEGGSDLGRFISRLRLLGMVGNCCGDAELRLNLGMTVSGKPSHRIGIAVNRSVRDFDDHDAACLDALRPHVIAAYRNALRSSARDLPPGGSSSGEQSMEHKLTVRESQVLYWVSMGKTNEEVGEIIGARPLTIKKHLEHIYDKLGVPNRTAAARLAAAERQPA